MIDRMSSSLWTADAVFTHMVNSFSGQVWVLDALMKLASSIGVPLMVLTVAVQWWSKSDRASMRHVLLSSGLSFLLGLAINQAVLLFVHRIRPYDVDVTQLLVAPSMDPSFPSDHATAAFAIAFTMLVLGHRWRWGYLAGAVLIGMSRTYLGLHYASDVLGGAVTALLAVVAVVAVFRKEMKAAQALVRVL
jgi:undecaprenyl-diphosphatase